MCLGHQCIGYVYGARVDRADEMIIPSGDMDTALVLRTGVYKDGVMYVQAGGGIVADSTGEDEYQETRHKAGALMRAIDLAEGQE